MTRFYAPIAKIDAPQRMVWGYASTEAEDADGETITIAALRDALDDYLEYSCLREMHQLSAVGKVKEAVIDDKGLYIGAKVIDDTAWGKVTARVYAGFSVGGKATARDPANRSVITGLKLTEISLVDRPANPEAVFDCWKAAGVGADDGEAALLEKISSMSDEERGFLLVKATRRNPIAGDRAVRQFLWKGI